MLLSLGLFAPRAHACSCRDNPLGILLPVVSEQELPGAPWLVASFGQLQATLNADGAPIPLDVQILEGNVFVCARSWMVARPLHPVDESTAVLALATEYGTRAEHHVRLSAAELERIPAALQVSVRRVASEPRELGSCSSSLVVNRTAFGKYEAELASSPDVATFLIVEADDEELGRLSALASTISPIPGYEAKPRLSVPILGTTSDCVTIRVLDWTGALLDLRELCPTTETITYTLDVEVSAQSVDHAPPGPEPSCACTTAPRRFGDFGALGALGLVTALSRIRARRR